MIDEGAQQDELADRKPWNGYGSVTSPRGRTCSPGSDMNLYAVAESRNGECRNARGRRSPERSGRPMDERDRYTRLSENPGGASCQTTRTGFYRCHDPSWLPGPRITT